MHVLVFSLFVCSLVKSLTQDQAEEKTWRKVWKKQMEEMMPEDSVFNVKDVSFKGKKMLR